MAKTLTLNTADLLGSPVAFPEYHEPIDIFCPPIDFSEYHEPIDIMADTQGPVHKLVDQVSRTPGRQPSPQPAHFSIPYKNLSGNGNGNGHRTLRSATVGYIAPEFKGKQAQMVEGECVQESNTKQQLTNRS